jgi:hypothetical protein
VEDNMKINVRDLGCEDVKWIHLTQETVNIILSLEAPGAQ